MWLVLIGANCKPTCCIGQSNDRRSNRTQCCSALKSITFSIFIAHSYTYIVSYWVLGHRALHHWWKSNNFASSWFMIFHRFQFSTVINLQKWFIDFISHSKLFKISIYCGWSVTSSYQNAYNNKQITNYFILNKKNHPFIEWNALKLRF